MDLHRGDRRRRQMCIRGRSELETRILNAGGRCLEIEKRLYSSILGAIIAQAPLLFTLARALAEFDLSAALARLAREEGWVRPTMTTEREFVITDGRHPVVEAASKPSGTQFVANVCDLRDDQHRFVTGPHM